MNDIFEINLYFSQNFDHIHVNCISIKNNKLILIRKVLLKLQILRTRGNAIDTFMVYFIFRIIFKAVVF